MQEKYRTLIYRITGVKSVGMLVDESLGVELEELHNRLLFAYTYVRPHFAGRKSSLGYNFVFRRLFDLLGHWEYGADFPPLKSRKKRLETVRLWRLFCAHLDWPYVNSDERLFGASYAVRPEELNGRGTRVARKQLRVQPVQSDTTPTSASPHPQSSDYQLRWGSADGSSSSGDWWSDDADMHDVFAALCRFGTCSDCGTDDEFADGIRATGV